MKKMKKGLLVLFLVVMSISLVLPDAHARYRRRGGGDGKYGFFTAAVIVGGLLVAIPVVGLTAKSLMGPTPQEKLELDMKKHIYGSLKGRIEERGRAMPDSVIDQVIIGALGGPIQAPPQPSPQGSRYPGVEPQSWQGHSQGTHTVPAVWQPAPGQNNQGGVYVINSSQVEEVD